MFREHMQTSSCAMRFICFKNIDASAFFVNLHTPVNSSSYEIRKIPILVDSEFISIITLASLQ